MPLGSAELVVRPAVAMREQALRAGVGVYLCLYEGEIDERANSFWSRWNPRVPGSENIPLELSDAVLYAAVDGTIVVVRGAASTFPLYWYADSNHLRFSTSLPVLEDEPFSRAGLVAAAAAASVHGSYEPNAFVETPLARWRRVRRASFLRFRDRRICEEVVVAVPWHPGDRSRTTIAHSVRAALDGYRQSQSGVERSLLEVSGGFDSTLAAAIPGRARMQGVSVAFPYYEFRFEGAVQQATADFLGIPRVEVDGLDLFPYAPSETPARLDEPSVFLTGIRHTERIARFAAECGAERIYTGHGGDQCFSTDLFARESLVPNPPGRGPFSGSAWRVVSRAIAAVRGSPWTDRRLGTFVYDARPDAWAKETFGTTLRTPFSDRAVFSSALDWSHWCKARGIRPDKTILAEAAPDLLPDAVLTRKGKVAYDGVWMRAYMRQAGHIAGVFEQASDTLSYIGISTNWLKRRVLDLGAWRQKSDREVLALYAIATWLVAWKLCRASELDWSD